MNGQELKQLRLKYNLTQKQVAEGIGTDRARISDWERNVVKKINPAYQILIKQFFDKLGGNK